MQPLDTTAGEPQPQDETGAGALQPQEETGAGVQHDGAGVQLDALPHPPLPPRILPNRPACASDADATTTAQTTRLATKNRLIGTSLGKQFSMTRKAGHIRLVLLSRNAHGTRFNRLRGI